MCEYRYIQYIGITFSLALQSLMPKKVFLSFSTATLSSNGFLLMSEHALLLFLPNIELFHYEFALLRIMEVSQGLNR